MAAILSTTSTYTRPPELDEKVDAAYQAIAEKTTSMWGLYNGNSQYFLCDIDEHVLVQDILSRREKKEYVFLDVGAGNFQWGDALARCVNSIEALDVKVTIIGIRGEKYEGSAEESVGKCLIYRRGNFKIERIGELLAPFTGKVDLAVSRWTLRHLVNPVDTWLQIHTLLTPHSGMALIDGFFFEIHEEIPPLPYNEKMVRLFADTASSIPQLLVYPHTKDHSLYHFFFRKGAERTLPFPMDYVNVSASKWDVASKTTVVFSRMPQSYDSLCVRITDNDSVVYGSSALYTMLCETRAYKTIPRLRLPLFHSDEKEKDFPYNERGETPLHTAIVEGRFPDAMTLLEDTYLASLPRADGMSPLHLAAALDSEGELLRNLIEKTPHELINTKNRKECLPSELAKEHGNERALTLLRMAQKRFFA